MTDPGNEKSDDALDRLLKEADQQLRLDSSAIDGATIRNRSRQVRQIKRQRRIALGVAALAAVLLAGWSFIDPSENEQVIQEINSNESLSNQQLQEELKKIREQQQVLAIALENHRISGAVERMRLDLKHSLQDLARPYSPDCNGNAWLTLENILAAEPDTIAMHPTARLRLQLLAASFPNTKAGEFARQTSELNP